MGNKYDTESEKNITMTSQFNQIHYSRGAYYQNLMISFNLNILGNLPYPTLEVKL